MLGVGEKEVAATMVAGGGDVGGRMRWPVAMTSRGGQAVDDAAIGGDGRGIVATKDNVG
jgi:hypothetical protein